MKKWISLALIFSVLHVAAQNSDSTTEKSKPHFKLSINYNSNLNYYGRTDSLKSSGVFPMAELWFTKHLYINAAPVFVNNSVQKMEYAGTVTTLGYQNVTDKWITSLSLLKPFYTQDAQLVQSALKAQGSVSVSRLTKVVNVNIGGDIKLSDKTDFGASAGLDHIVRKENKDGSVLVFDPSFYAYAGTQNFTNTYNKKKSGFLLFPGSQQQVTENVQQFNVLAYEASMPIIYARNKWMFIAVPSYVIPQNLISVPNRPDLSEQGENLFYTTLSVKYTF